MRIVSRRFMVLAGLGALTGTAVAQPAGPGGAPPGPMPGGGRGGPGMMMGRGGGPGMGGPFADHTAYLAGIKAELGITEAQEAAWKTYADAVKAAAGQMQAMHQTMWDAMGTATWEERRDMMNRAFQARQQAFQAVHDAAQALLPSLTERQKATADIILPGLARRGRRGRM